MSTGRFITLAVVVCVLGVPDPAAAQGAPTITLEASDRHLNFGESSRLSGRITPESEDQGVDIVDAKGRILAATTTDDGGRFEVDLAPTKNVSVRAVWAGGFSDFVEVNVRPLIDVSLGHTFLFDLAKVRGQIRPGSVNKPVKLQLRRAGKVVESKRVNPKAGGWFKTTFRIGEPGSYRVKASYTGGDHLPTADKSAQHSTPLPNLSSGSNSIFVKLLERRLRQLNYRVPPANFQYDHRTSDGIIAFNKVQGRPRIGYVTDSTWRALASPKIPKARFRSPRYHIEVDQTKQVLYRVLKGKVITIMHVSTGAGAATRDGTFQVWSRLAGYSSKRLYYPSFFDGARGIHGWPSVPTYNASHGCVRVPMWTAVWIYNKLEIGSTVRIYH